MKGYLRIAILTMGFSGLVAQMLLLRELLIVFSGNELSIGIILANWLIIEAFGSFFLGKRAETARNRVETFVGVTMLFSLVLPGEIYLTRILKNILGVSIGESIGLLPMLYSSFLILLPVSVSHGMLFTYSCKIYSEFSARDASSIGMVYVYETIGTIAGGIVWTYLLILHFQAFQMAIGLGVLNFLVCFALLMRHSTASMLRKTLAGVAGLLSILSGYLLFTGGADELHHLSVRSQWKDLNVMHYQNSIYGNVCVVENEGQYIFFMDGIPQVIIPIPDIVFVEEFVHLPLLSHPDPRRILIISGGAGGVINEILKHPSVELVEYAELDPLVLELIRKFSTPLTERELTDGRVKVMHVDGRLFLKMTRNRYDLILVGLHDPSDLQINRFFTKEFFLLAKSRLNEEGILVNGLPGSLAYLNRELKNLNACIFNTLKRVFSHIRAFPGDGTNLFLASDSEAIFMLNRAQLINRLNQRGIKASVPIARHIEKKLHPGWHGWFLRFIEGGSEKVNTDLKPLGVFYSISYWNALFASHLREVFAWFETLNLWVFVALSCIFVAFILLARSGTDKTSALAIPFCIATTGFAGMIFDLVLIFAFQSIYGYVFSWIGLLVTSFMAGAALGAMAVTSLIQRMKGPVEFLMKIEMTIILFSLVLPFVFLLLSPHFGTPERFALLRALFLTLSFSSGGLVGAQFPLANSIYMRDKSLSETAGLLYSSDLLGGWLGGVVGGVLLLPVLGLLGACMVVALLKLSSFTVVMLSKTSLRG